MSKELMSEVWLRKELLPLVEGSPPPFAASGARAAQRRLRRNRFVGWSAGGLAVAGLTAAGTFQLIPYGPFHSQHDVPLCNASTIVSGSAETLKIGTKDLPSDILLAWPSDAGPPPGAAYARQDVTTCANPPRLRLIDVQSDRVARTIDISAVADGPDGALSTTGGEPSPSDQDEQPADAIIRGKPGRLLATWHTAQGFTYGIETAGVSRNDLQTLLNDTSATRGTVDVSRWPGRSKFEHQGSTSIATYGTRDWWELSAVGTDGAGDLVSLHVIQDPDPLILSAEVGDRLTTIAGAPALDSISGGIMWKPSETATAQVSGSMSTQHLLQIAASVVRLEPGDPRVESIVQ